MYTQAYVYKTTATYLVIKGIFLSLRKGKKLNFSFFMQEIDRVGCSIVAD